MERYCGFTCENTQDRLASIAATGSGEEQISSPARTMQDETRQGDGEDRTPSNEEYENGRDNNKASSGTWFSPVAQAWNSFVRLHPPANTGARVLAFLMRDWSPPCKKSIKSLIPKCLPSTVPGTFHPIDFRCHWEGRHSVRSLLPLRENSQLRSLCRLEWDRLWKNHDWFKIDSDVFHAFVKGHSLLICLVDSFPRS